ncbi:MAG TPA: DUF4388 domain-containing protein [Acidimicrobiales bacterium]|nr:DUF4388 domain-containing protein [Acidimicrobiales bacterium]
MPLQGTFDVLDFSEVLRLLAEHHMTGRLYVRHRSFGANLFLESGLLIGADQSEHQPAAAIGDVAGRLEEVCFEMLEADRGSFEYHPGRASSLPVTTRHAVDDVLGRARKRLDEWRELQEAIPSLDLQPKLVLEMVRPQVTLDQERWRMLTAIDGRRNLRAIGRVINLSDFDVCRVVRSLIDDGIVELDGLGALSASSRDAMPVVPAPDGVPGVTFTTSAPPEPKTDDEAEDPEPEGHEPDEAEPANAPAPAAEASEAGESAGDAREDGERDPDPTPPGGIEVIRVIDDEEESVTVTRPEPSDVQDPADSSAPATGEVPAVDGDSPAGEAHAASDGELGGGGPRARLVRIRSRQARAHPRTI